MIERRASHFDRRFCKDRRKLFKFPFSLNKRIEKRSTQERRSRHELRREWVRVDKWSSVRPEELKIAKFLH